MSSYHSKSAKRHHRSIDNGRNGEVKCPKDVVQEGNQLRGSILEYGLRRQRTDPSFASLTPEVQQLQIRARQEACGPMKRQYGPELSKVKITVSQVEAVMNDDADGGIFRGHEEGIAVERRMDRASLQRLLKVYPDFKPSCTPVPTSPNQPKSGRPVALVVSAREKITREQAVSSASERSSPVQTLLDLSPATLLLRCSYPTTF
ncbi:hypothetical protein LTR62_001722 [Meristemomyces frigidus]|uniref:Uncharacterized protein n=1 Tax=Meristemomyces frigidus TaxID=1508187 RepID=A0AAN7YLI7_9PEZI|nr:hypothetical protein LTR62_001722 [Meristemomyces frigidus]